MNNQHNIRKMALDHQAELEHMQMQMQAQMDALKAEYHARLRAQTEQRIVQDRPKSPQAFHMSQTPRVNETITEDDHSLERLSLIHI